MNKLVSIILPTYNGSKWIKKAIESVQNQTYTNWELLVIDDGSCDNTAQITIEIAKVDPRIIYIKNEQNLGIQKTLNKGIKEAKGEYIARIDDDDEWVDIEKLNRQAEFLDNNKDYVLVGTGAILVNEKNNEISRFLLPEKDIEVRRKILSKNCFVHSSVVFKKSFALQVGCYDESENIRHIEDYDLWIKLGTVGKFANLPFYSVSLMQRENTISNKNRIIQARRSLVEILKFKDKYTNFLFGYLIAVARYFFFLAQKIIPFNENMVYRIKNKYKNF